MILIVANDKRMTYVAEILAKSFKVRHYGENIEMATVKFAILPFKIDEVEMGKLIKELPHDCLIFTPIMRCFLQNIPQPIEVIMDQDEIAIYNSIPTSEGTLYYIMKNTECTIHNSNIHVIGAGRCGETLAKNLKALGANVTISSRSPKLVARLFESGIPVTNTDATTLKNADIIVNTVPALMLDESQLKYVKKDVYIADIASAPGGVDFESAKALGINAELLPALPGIVAPRTAAIYLADFIKRKIEQN